MARLISVVPSYLELKVGEEKQVQIITETEDEFVTVIDPREEVIEFDNIHNEIKGLKEGFGYIKFCILNEDKTIKEYDSIRVEVFKNENNEKPVRIMMHNKGTNRLTTLVAQNDNKENLEFKIPDIGKRTSTLATSYHVENAKSFIHTPVILSPEDGTLDHISKFESSEFKVSYGVINRTLTSSQWQVALDPYFEKIIVDEKKIKDMLTFTTSYFGISVYVRVRYYSGIDVSAWSSPIFVTFSDKTKWEELPSLVYGNFWDGGLYGILDFHSYEPNRDYRGNWKTLFDNNLKEFKVNQSVSHNDKLWECVLQHTATEENQPGTAGGFWKEDTRENLPTFEWLLNRIGIGLGQRDNNQDGYSSDAQHTGTMQNIDTNRWVKYIYKGRMLYVASHCVCEQIAWNDLAKRNVVYGDRTVRILNSTYKIRLLKEEEFRMLIEEIPTRSPYLGNNKLSAIKRSPNEIIEDFSTGTTRTVINNDGVKTQIDAKSRTGSYRPVLELIQEGAEPFNNIPECVQATNENFRYDKYTDTGYFGQVPQADIATYEKIEADLNWTNGGRLYTDTGWYKFYFQGLIIYVMKQPLRNYWGTKTNGWDKHAAYFVDLGHGNKKHIKINGKEYLYGNMTGGSIEPRTTGLAVMDGKEHGRGSMYMELIPRITAGYVTNKSKNDGTWLGGDQVGDNWENTPLTTTIPGSYEIYLAEGVNYTTNQGQLNNGIDCNLGTGSDDTALVCLMLKTW